MAGKAKKNFHIANSWKTNYQLPLLIRVIPFLYQEFKSQLVLCGEYDVLAENAVIGTGTK